MPDDGPVIRFSQGRPIVVSLHGEPKQTPQWICKGCGRRRALSGEFCRLCWVDMQYAEARAARERD